MREAVQLYLAADKRKGRVVFHVPRGLHARARYL